MAAIIQDALDVTVALEPGGRGEFSVWVGEDRVANKSLDGFPAPPAVVDAVRARL